MKMNPHELLYIRDTVKSEMLSDAEYIDVYMAIFNTSHKGTLDMVRDVDIIVSALDAFRTKKMAVGAERQEMEPQWANLKNKKALQSYRRNSFPLVFTHNLERTVNKLINDEGIEVEAAGAPGSITRLKCERPGLIKLLVEMSETGGTMLEVLGAMREAGVSSRFEISNMFCILIGD